jgi:uncharacterized protein DUF6160
MFKKLALVTAIAALPVSGFAMEALEDSALSDVTGQDGITIGITTPNLTLDVLVHDNDGLGNTNGITATGAGTIVIENMVVNTGGNEIVAVIDADDNGGAPLLNVGVTIPTGTTISTGDLSVATSNGMGVAVTNQTAVIMDSMDIVLGATSLNIQLGNEAQGVGGLPGTYMIALNTAITGGITINNFSLNDASLGGGSISAASILVDGDGGALGVVAGVNLDGTDGLAISVDQLGTATGLSVQMTDLALGTGTAIGDVEIVGLNLNGTVINVRGHGI